MATNEARGAKATLNDSLLEVLACPENLSPVRLATEQELAAVNERVARQELRRWDESRVEEPLAGLLIREDGKIGYEIQDGIPIMLIDSALVLDAAVGSPKPQEYRS